MSDDDYMKKAKGMPALFSVSEFDQILHDGLEPAGWRNYESLSPAQRQMMLAIVCDTTSRWKGIELEIIRKASIVLKQPSTLLRQEMDLRIAEFARLEHEGTAYSMQKLPMLDKLSHENFLRYAALPCEDRDFLLQWVLDKAWREPVSDGHDFITRLQTKFEHYVSQPAETITGLRRSMLREGSKQAFRIAQTAPSDSVKRVQAEDFQQSSVKAPELTVKTPAASQNMLTDVTLDTALQQLALTGF